MSKKLVVAAIAVGCLSLTGLYAVAQEAKPKPAQEAKAKPGQVDKKTILPSLFVMTSDGYSYKDGKLTLKGITPNTIIFADRPARMAGHVPTEALVQDWSQGKASFEKDPPNADLSTFTGTGSKNAVVELRNPVLHNGTLTFDVKVLQGTLDDAGGQTSLFIDVIGMPWTPMSYAGVARRTAARSLYWSAPHAIVL
jgi:hypothetical protein